MCFSFSKLALIVRNQCARIIYGRVLFIFLFINFSENLFGQTVEDYNEVSVQFIIPRLGYTEMPVLLKNNDAWIDVKALFDYIKIKNEESEDFNTLTGFFIDAKFNYLIDKSNRRIIFKGKVFDLDSTDLLKTEAGLYLRSVVLDKVFQLNCLFNFRNLSFTLNSEIELPVWREMQQDQIRKNIDQLKKIKKADTIIKKSFSLINFGIADWSITAMQQSGKSDYFRSSLTLGTTVAGGEASAYINYYGNQKFSFGKQLYRWRYVNNDFSIFKQIALGHISTQSVTSIFTPLNGIQITNTPTVYRKSFGSYRYTGTTKPAWTVELFINNIFIDYVKADGLGFFAFEIPLVYGNSSIRLKFYGPWGEELSHEENILIPFNFLPVGQFEYSLNAGVLQNETNKIFTRAVMNYGISRWLTVGSGAEYLTSANYGKPMPFLNASVRLLKGIILAGEYNYGVRAKATVNYRLPNNLQFDLSYIKYDKGQTAIRFNFLDERNVTLTAPIHFNNFRVLSRFNFSQFVLTKFRYSSAEFLLSATLAGISSNIRTYAQFSTSSKPLVYSNISMAFQLPYAIRLSPRLQYQYDIGNFSQFKAEAEKKISQKGYLNLSFECNRYLHISNFTLGFRYDFSFARTFISSSRNNKNTITSQSASGSFTYQEKAGYMVAKSQPNAGKGGFLVIPFLDINCNGKWDRNEPRVNGLRLHTNAGQVERRNDSSLLIYGLEAYSNCLIELDSNSFDNIAWRIKNPLIQTIVNPNRIVPVEVPIAVLGEVTGMVYQKKHDGESGVPRILINFYNNNHKFVARSLTESDGFFSFLGLTPGQYTAEVDPLQLDILGLVASSRSMPFSINVSQEGGIVDGIKFILQDKQ